MVDAKDGKFTLDGKGKVTKADLAASNGVVQIVDTVFSAAAPKEEPKKPAEKKPG